MLSEEELREGFYIGDWEVLPGKGVLRRGDQEERPEPKVFAVLIALARRDTNLVTKQELIDEVWGGRPTSDEPIARCLSQLRGHLDDRQTPHVFIETIQKRGYRLIEKVKLDQPWWTRPILKKSIAAVLAVVLIGVIATNIDSRPTQPPSPPARSIAVMPFQNLSGSEADEYLVLGFKEELVQILQGLDDYTVKSIRGEYDDKEPDEIAREFGVGSLLMGSLRRSGDDLKISYQIATDGTVANGGKIEGTVEDLFSLQESLAVMVRDSLVGESAQVLIKSRPSDSSAYDGYMRGMYALEHRGDPGNLEKAIELFNNAIRLDRNYGPPYLALATVYALMPNYRGSNQLEMDALALDTIEKGIDADPNLADTASFVWGYQYHKQKRWDEAEAAYVRAINADVIDSNAFNWYSRMLASVGRLDDSLEQSLAGLELDPGSPLLNSRTAMSYAWLQNTEKALMYYERANDLGWSGTTHVLGYSFILIQTGQIEKAQNLAHAAVEMAGAPTGWVAPVFAAMTDPGRIQEALEALDESSVIQPVSPLADFTVRALLGDLDGAMRIAQLLEKPGEVFEMDMLFIPEFAALRRHPDFMPLLDRLGITDYWLKKGCVWNGDRVICPN